MNSSQKSLKSILKKKSVGGVSQDSSGFTQLTQPAVVETGFSSRSRLLKQLDHFNKSQRDGRSLSPTGEQNFI